jgi:magnesium-transporting ATPase (P-type)
MVFVVLLLSCFSMMAQRLMYDWHRVSDWYLFGQDVGVAPTLMGFIIMYNTLIPLSLYVTMEIIKVMQLLFLQFDIDMYHAESNTPADAKTATILEELGQVSFVFTDKTGTLTDNKMEFRKFTVCGESWLHNLDLLKENAAEPSEQLPSTNTERARTSMDAVSLNSHTSYRSTAKPNENQEYKTSLQLLKHLQLHPNTIFSKKVKFFLLSIALCNTCLPRSSAPESSSSSRNSSMEDISTTHTNDNDSAIEYQAASPDELALVKAARDLGYVVFDKQANTLTIKTYPMGFENDARLETYEVLQIVEFTSARKRMSAVVRFPDQRICLLCKGADNIIIEKLKNSQMVQQKAKEISQNSADRKLMEADIVLQSRFSNELESRKSLSSLRQRLSFDSLRDGQERAITMNSIDNFLLNEGEGELTEVASQHRKSLHIQQVKKYSLDSLRGSTSNEPSKPGNSTDGAAFSVPNDRLVLHEEYVAERTLQHIEEFSTEGLRTLMYSFKWLDEKEYETWAEKYASAKTALTNRAALVEEVGGEIEYDLELLGATAIEDKLQDGVSEAIEKLRRAGIKLWMLTGDKRETAINIGYSCRLIKDYSTVLVLSNDEPRDTIVQRITSAISEIQAGRVAHFVLVIDGATLGELESDSTIMTLFFELCVLADSTICCRASPSQKASMVTSVRALNKRAVTLAIGDGANDIAMIQSADIGVGITGKEGLQAARSADYAIAQFRFLLKLLLVHGRYNYVRTSKFVLCTFYKELLFYLTQALYQRNTLFSGSSLYESWSLSMFNTLFTSLPILCIGMFDKDLKPATLIAVPELYAKGREYRAFNLRVFVSWMFLAALQSVGISFISWYIWGFTALRDNSVLPLGTMMFAALTIIINAKITLIEMQNRQWLAFASFIISVGGYGLWNVLIMFLYRSKESPIFFVAYGLLIFGSDASWWASLLILFTIPLLFDIFLKVFLFSVRPSDDQIFQVFEKNIELRRLFEQKAIKELAAGWTYPKELSIWRKWCVKGINRIRKVFNMDPLHIKEKEEALGSLNASTSHRKRAGTNPNPTELPPGSGGEAIRVADRDNFDMSDYDILPSGKMVKIASSNPGILSKIGRRFGSTENVDEIIAHRLESLRKQEEGNY